MNNGALWEERSSFWVSLFIAWLLLCITSGGFVQGNGHNFAAKAASGVYVQDLPSPIFYDTFLPLILEYILPHWNKSDVTFNNWYNCTSETAPYRYTCPSVYHMNRAVLNLHIDFLALQPVTDDAPHSEYYSNLMSHSSFCNLIQRHFSGIYIQDDELTTYIRALEKCNTDTLENDSALVFLQRAMPDYNFSIRHPFTKMESNFYNIFYKSITGTNGTLDLVASATLSNARATIQGSLLSVYYAEKYRWSHAVQDCNAQVIPHSLITSQSFLEKLDQISKRDRFLNNYKYAIPLSLISKYYSVPLADCTYTNETFVVRIQIPVNTIGTQGGTSELTTTAQPRLITLTPATFIYRKKVCSVQINSQQRFAFDTINKIAYRTKCKSNELCLQSDTFSNRFQDPCATALINENFEQVLTYCTFKCLPVFDWATFGDEVTSVGKHKFLVTGHGTKTVVRCHKSGSSSASPPSSPDTSELSHVSFQENSNVETLEFVAEDDGSFEMTLPCNCSLNVHGRRFYSSDADGCGVDTEVTINHVTPWHLLKNMDKDGDDLSPDPTLLNFYTIDAGRKDRTLPIEGAEASTAVFQEGSSQAALWTFFVITSLVLFLVQCYIIYLLRQSSGMNYSRHHQLVFKARDPEPQVGLLETADENI